MINPCVKCPERDRCEEMNQPCKQGKAYQKWKAGCKRVADLECLAELSFKMKRLVKFIDSRRWLS